MKLKFHLRNDFAVEIITALMILLIVYTGVSKLITQTTFFQQIKKAPYVGLYALWLTWLVPVSELVVAVLLLFRTTRLLGYYSFLFLMSLFTIYIGAMIAIGNSLPCSCGGIIQQLSWKQHMVLNSCFLLLSMVGLMYQYQLTKK